MCFGLSCNNVDSHECFCVDEAFEQNSVERCLIACVWFIQRRRHRLVEFQNNLKRNHNMCLAFYDFTEKCANWMKCRSITVEIFWHIFGPNKTFFFFNFFNRCWWSLFVAVPKWWSQSSGIGQQAAQFARSQKIDASSTFIQRRFLGEIITNTNANQYIVARTVRSVSFSPVLKSIWSKRDFSKKKQ